MSDATAGEAAVGGAWSPPTPPWAGGGCTQGCVAGSCGRDDREEPCKQRGKVWLLNGLTSSYGSAR